jgi:hypothetical protein
MNYIVLYASMASILVAAGLTNILYQPVSASTDIRDICTVSPALCKGIAPRPIDIILDECIKRPWLCEEHPRDFPWPGPIELRDILSIPENQSYSVSVRHGPVSDTIMIEIPKALSSSILNQSTTGFDPQQQPSGSSILNQSTQQPPMVESN